MKDLPNTHFNYHKAPPFPAMTLMLLPPKVKCSFHKISAIILPSF